MKLVREAHTERRALLRVVAPHLVRRIPFLFPVYRGGPYRPATIQAGLWTYSTLAGEKLGGLVRPERARRSVPALRARGPARLRRLPGRVDARRPALPRQRDRGGGGRRDGAQLSPRSSTFVSRAGKVRGRRGARSDLRRVGLGRGTRRRQRDGAVARDAAPPGGAGRGPYGQLSKGVHVTLPLDEPWSAALTIPHDQVRVTFAYPWEGMLLLGTTDTPVRGRSGGRHRDRGRRRPRARRGGGRRRPAPAPRRSACSRPTPACGCSHAATAQPSTPAARRRSCRARAGCSPSPAASSRRTGGSHSTRSAACRQSSGSSSVDRRPVPLPGATDAGNVAARLVTGWGLEPAVAAHLAHFYGSRADRVVGLAAERPELLERLHPDAPDIAAQVVFAAREEWATSADDVVQRRTSLGARGLAGPELTAAVAELLEQASEDSSEPKEVHGAGGPRIV